jgi:hypothetical protein
MAKFCSFSMSLCPAGACEAAEGAPFSAKREAKARWFWERAAAVAAEGSE